MSCSNHADSSCPRLQSCRDLHRLWFRHVGLHFHNVQLLRTEMRDFRTNGRFRLHLQHCGGYGILLGVLVERYLIRDIVLRRFQKSTEIHIYVHPFPSPLVFLFHSFNFYYPVLVARLFLTELIKTVKGSQKCYQRHWTYSPHFRRIAERCIQYLIAAHSVVQHDKQSSKGVLRSNKWPSRRFSSLQGHFSERS